MSKALVIISKIIPTDFLPLPTLAIMFSINYTVAMMKDFPEQNPCCSYLLVDFFLKRQLFEGSLHIQKFF